MHQKSLAFDAKQTVVESAQSFQFNVFNRADMVCCASFPFWEAGVFCAFKVEVSRTAQCFEVEYLHYKNNGRIIEMKANYLCPWHKVTVWFSPLSRILAASIVQGGIIKCRVPLTRRFVLIKNRVLAVSSVGDEAPPAPAGRNGGCDEL